MCEKKRRSSVFFARFLDDNFTRGLRLPLPSEGCRRQGFERLQLGAEEYQQGANVGS